MTKVIPFLFGCGEGTCKTSHLRALLGVIILFTARAQIVVIRAANDKEVLRHFVNEKEKE